ncbi:4-oxalocrotonate tautomerase [Salmonella enterica]|uniref:4-oxalocrotonate tautomerase n=1 Tax=Salmonella enterica TaxID=28901 RepID=A0A5U2K8C5_SALER|nr:4-oxalocrotonate tautomerase [Salmonella enterica]EBP3896970.1 4-oxalocrotonate tautomerase [Salmonella enterica subsp. enterica]EDS8587764.1 4-oxalocrotonate tautomerase [Salmonella enterica subsp. enterica serovar Inverness]EKB3222625.1 tautomerase family protein [Salmonella enterica subsp. enterica serovar Gaminara]EKV6446999.1 tautomerase family protein [Klebsiella oxytoca]
MPHIIVKIVGQTEDKKKMIAKALTDTLSKSLGISDKFISLSIEDILKEDWVEDVYKPEIIGKSNNLYKKPGYDPL